MNHRDGPDLQRRVLVSAIASGLAAFCMPLPAQPMGFPNRPLHLFVAAPAGGPQDQMARMLAQDMARRLEQPIVVENRAGAAGALAAEPVARAPADGHVLLLSAVGNATNHTLVPTLSYDINRDFAHITLAVAGPNLLVAYPGLGLHSFQDMLAFARGHPGKLLYASAGNGSSGHLAMEMLKQRAEISLLHIPYRGGAPALNDLLAGHVHLMFINQDAVLPYARSGRLVLLAATSLTRHPAFPGVPTVAESGFRDFEATAWAGLSAPRDTPAHVIDRLNAAAVAALHGPLRARLEALGFEVIGSTPAEYAVFMRRETEKWARVIRAAGIKSS